jgi:hypothetical protein
MGQDFIKHVRVQLTGIPEPLKPMVECGRFVVLGDPVWRRCLPNVGEVMNLKLLRDPNLVLVRGRMHESPKKPGNVRSSAHPPVGLDTQKNGSQCNSRSPAQPQSEGIHQSYLMCAS